MENNYFSIIIPVYNMEKYIEASIESIINQSFKDFELILVNDGSKDDSQKICEKYEKLDKRIKLISTENQGSGPARNIGIENASGKYLYFPDADDILFENSLEEMYEETMKKEANLYVFAYKEFTRDNKNEVVFEKVDEFYSGNEIRKNFEITVVDIKRRIKGAPWNKLFLTKKVKENKIEYPALKRHQDEVFICRYIDIIESVKFCNKCIYKHYVNDLEDKFNKFPKNYFDIATTKYNELYKIIVNWNKENCMPLIDVSYNYIIDVWNCFLYTYSPKWNMDSRSRKEYVKEILKNEKLKETIHFLLNNKKQFDDYLSKLNNSMKTKFVIMIKLTLMKMKKDNIILLLAKKKTQ